MKEMTLEEAISALESIKVEFKKVYSALTVATMALSAYEAKSLYEENDATAALIEMEKILSN